MGLQTQIVTSFTPFVVNEDGAYLPAVRMESSLHDTTTTVYQMSFEDEPTAMVMARTFCDEQYRMYESSMQSAVDSLKKRPASG